MAGLYDRIPRFSCTEEMNNRNWAATAEAISQLGESVGGPDSFYTATGNWVAPSPGNSYATVAATDPRGTAVTVRIYYPPFRAPNVRIGNVFPVRIDGLGVIVADPAFTLDDPIGTQKPWNSTNSIPQGWQSADGTNGTQNLNGGQFFKGNATSGTTAAAGNTGSASTGLTIDSGGSGTTGSGGGGSTSSESTGITVDDHPASSFNHSHAILGWSGVDAGQDGSAQAVDINGVPANTELADAVGTDVAHTVNETAHSHTVSSHDHTTPAHSHTTSESPHTHTAGEPASVTLFIIERVA